MSGNKKSPTRTAQPKRSLAERNSDLMTLAEVADMLAVTERMVIGLTQSGELPMTKVGSLRRWHRETVANYIARQRGDAA